MKSLNNKHKNSFLSFVCGNETFAIPVTKVLEVLQKQNLTELPEMPEIVKGVMNFRGDILPVFDMRIRFNFRNFDTEKFVIIVLEIDGKEKKNRLCVIVDRVKDVISIDEAMIKPVTEFGLKYKTEYLNGIIFLDSEYITVLSADKIFSDQVNLLSEAEI